MVQMAHWWLAALLVCRALMRFLSFALAVILGPAAACGDNYAVPMPDAPPGDPPPDSGVDEDGCRILTVGTRDFQFNLFDQLLGVRFPVTPNLGGARADVLRVELYDSTTPELPPLTTGTFDLSAVTDLATCQHCVWVEVDATEDGTVDTIYLATNGALTIDSITDPLGPVFAAHTERAVLRRAQVGENGHTTLVPGGDCISVTALSFNTTTTRGQACESALDCGNPLLEICDPSSNTCTEPECNFDTPCSGDGELCLIQYRHLFDGACYQTCNPSASTNGCPAAQACTQRGPDPSFGICKYVGTGALGAVCEVEDNTTSCAGEAVCSAFSERCVASCSFYADEPGCPGYSMCSLFGLCEAPWIGESVALGAACGADAYQAQGCAPDGEVFRGICFGFEGDPLTCQKACLGDQGCGSGEFCAQRYATGVGICLPLPVCGDGVRGEINEVCDDGNTMDGDGCSADCQTAETDVLCTNATSLALGAPTQGNTASGADGLMSSCQAGLARADLFGVAPPGRGRLRLHLTSQTSQTLSLRTNCADVASELACRGELGVATDGELVVQVTDATPAPLTAMVSAMTVIEEGPYTIVADFVPEQCGDGVIAGREACDDNNTNGNDGCSADCFSFEYDWLCAQAPVLSTSAATTGDLTAAPALFGSSCATDEGLDLHPSRLHRFVAPAAGTLHLDLDDGTGLAVLAVRDGCGEPSATSELACRPAFLNGEIDVPLAAGQAITAVVTSYFLDDMLGTYTLQATFTPL